MIIAQLTQANASLAAKVPELEAPHEQAPERRGGPETVVEEPPKRAEPRSGSAGPPMAEAPERAFTEEEPEPRSSWWRRVFGG